MFRRCIESTRGRGLDDKYLSAALSAAEMIRRGCTACFDLTVEFPEPSCDGMSAVARAYQDAGMRAVVGDAIFLTITALLGLALGFLVRNTAGGIASFAGVMFVLPGITAILPHSWGDSISPYLPLNAGTAMLSLSPDPGSLAPWTGMLLYLGYAAAALAIAALLLVRRDA